MKKKFSHLPTITKKNFYEEYFGDFFLYLHQSESVLFYTVQLATAQSTPMLMFK